MTIYVVVTQGMAHGAYKNPTLATTHARTITGGLVVECELYTTMPAFVRDDVGSDSWEDDATPVEIPAEAAERLKQRSSSSSE